MIGPGILESRQGENENGLVFLLLLGTCFVRLEAERSRVVAFGGMW